MDINFGNLNIGFPGPISKKSNEDYIKQQVVTKEEEKEAKDSVNSPRAATVDTSTTSTESYSVPQQSLGFPIIHIRKVNLEQQKAKIKFYFEIPYDGENSKIFETTPDFMSIKIVKVQDDNLFSFLNLSKQLVLYSSSPSKIKNVPSILLNIAKEIRLIEKADGEELAQIFKDSSKIQTMDFPISSNVAIARKVEMPDGSIKVDMEYETEISIDDTNHLSLYVYPQFDESRLRELNIQYDLSVENIKVNSEIVLNRGKKIVQTYAYFLTNSSTKQRFVWPGFVHKDINNGSWMTGQPNDKQDFKKPLKREVFFNTKIKDNLIFEKMDRIPLISSRTISNISDVVSPIKFGSTTPDGVSFLINTELLLEKYSSAYKKVSSINLKNSNILQEIKIYKKRVKQENNTISDYSKNEQKQYLPRETFVLDNTNPINLVTFLDEEEKIGQYCYGIEITFKDVIVNELKNILTSLKEGEAFLKTYLNDSQSLGLNYDSEKDCFTDQFKQKYMENREIAISIQKYIEGVLRICTISSFSEEIKKQIILHVSPKHGTPSGINRFLNSYQTLISRYQKIINNASENFLFTEEKYFNKVEQVLEYKRAQVQDTSQEEIYGNFFSNNKVSIGKETGPNSYTSLFSKDEYGKMRFWESIQQTAKQELTDWVSLTKYLYTQKPYKDRQEKYTNAISSLQGIPEPVRMTDIRETPNILFNSTKKANKAIEQQDISSLFFSINETPKKSTTGNVSDLKINEVMSYSADLARGGR